MPSPPALADAYARAALAHPDGSPLLRETLDEFRWRLADVEGGLRRLLRLLLMQFSFVGVLAVAAAAWEFIGPVWLRVLVTAAVIPLPLLVPRRLPVRRAPLPEPEGALPELLDGMLDGVRGRSFHVEACAARAWSLGNGGPAATSGEQPFVPRQSEASRFEAHQVDQTVWRAHQLLHLQTATDPETRHRLARYDHVHRRLASAAALLRGGVSYHRSQRRARVFAFVMFVAVLVAGVLLARPWWFMPFIAAASTPSSVLSAMYSAKAACPRRVADPWTEPQLLAAVETHLAEARRLPGATAARAAEDLTAARDLLRP